MKLELVVDYLTFTFNIISHYQYLGVLILGGAVFILHKAFEGKFICSKIWSSLAFILSSVNLIFGLFVYREAQKQFKYLLGLNGIAHISLTSIEKLLSWQSWIAFAAFLFLLISAVVYYVENKK